MTDVARLDICDGDSVRASTDDEFGGKRYLKMVRCRAECPLGFFARVVYSGLLYKRRDGVPVTARRIGEIAGIDAGRTVPRALQELKNHGLVARARGGHEAVLPVGAAAGWFPCDSRGLHSWKLYLKAPPSPLTAKENALYCLAYSLTAGGGRKSGQTKAGLAALMGISRRSTYRELDVLAAHGLVRAEGYTLVVATPSAEQRRWWLDSTGANPPRALAEGSEATTRSGASFRPGERLRWRGTDAESQTYIGFAIDHIAGHAPRMLAARYYEGAVLEYWNWVARELRNAEAVAWFSRAIFPCVWDEAEEIHRVHGRKGNCSLGLLKKKTAERLDAARGSVSPSGRIPETLVIEE